MWEPSYDYLEHHGIKRQKWGVRNGPPYPLDYDDHSAAQKKANPKGSLDNYDRKQAEKDFKKVNKKKRGFTSDRLANTKTVKEIYKNNRDELVSLRTEAVKAKDKWIETYENERKKRDDGKKHPDYKWEQDDYESELAADKLAGKDLKNARDKYVDRCKELAREAFGDFSSMPLSSLNGRPSNIETYIADAIDKIDDDNVLRDIILGRRL